MTEKPVCGNVIFRPPPAHRTAHPNLPAHRTRAAASKKLIALGVRVCGCSAARSAHWQKCFGVRVCHTRKGVHPRTARRETSAQERARR
jgi:hypothetical protein